MDELLNRIVALVEKKLDNPYCPPTHCAECSPAVKKAWREETLGRLRLLKSQFDEILTAFLVMVAEALMKKEGVEPPYREDELQKRKDQAFDILTVLATAFLIGNKRGATVEASLRYLVGEKVTGNLRIQLMMDRHGGEEGLEKELRSRTDFPGDGEGEDIPQELEELLDLLGDLSGTRRPTVIPVPRGISLADILSRLGR